MNKLVKKLQLKTFLQYTLAILFATSSYFAQAQEISLENSKKYTIAEIKVAGNTTFSEQTIITFSKLKKGDEILIPGEEISAAIKKLWKTNLFSDIEVYLAKTEGNAAYLEIRLADLPTLNELKINGVKKSKKEALIKENKLQDGVKVTENLITTTKNYIQNKNRKAGFLNTKVSINTIPVKDSLQNARVNMVLNVDRGEKVKVSSIILKAIPFLVTKSLEKQ